MGLPLKSKKNNFYGGIDPTFHKSQNYLNSLTTNNFKDVSDWQSCTTVQHWQIYKLCIAAQHWLICSCRSCFKYYSNAARVLWNSVVDGEVVEERRCFDADSRLSERRCQLASRNIEFHSVSVNDRLLKTSIGIARHQPTSAPGCT